MKKNKIYPFLIISFFLMCLSMGGFSLNVVAEESSETNISLELSKRIKPNDLPGTETNSNIEMKQQNKPTSGKLPQTGSVKGQLSYLGLCLISILVAVKIFEKKYRKVEEE